MRWRFCWMISLYVEMNCISGILTNCVCFHWWPIVASKVKWLAFCYSFRISFEAFIVFWDSSNIMQLAMKMIILMAFWLKLFIYFHFDVLWHLLLTAMYSSRRFVNPNCKIYVFCEWKYYFHIFLHDKSHVKLCQSIKQSICYGKIADANWDFHFIFFCLFLFLSYYI